MGFVGDTATDCQWYIDAGASIGDLRQQLIPRFVAGGDVEPAQLVGSLRGVAQGCVDGLATVAEVDELDALDDTPARDIKARDDAAAQHQTFPSQARNRCKNSRPPADERSG